MLVKYLLKYKHVVYKQKHCIQFILLFLATLFIFKKPSDTNVSSNDLLFKKLEYPYKILPKKFIDEFSSIKSPANTILILCDPKDLIYFDLIYGSIKDFKCSYREIVLTFARKLYSKYFTVIYLSFGDENFTSINLLRNTQPNSDLASISRFYFPNKYRFKIDDLVYQPDLNFGFSLNIQLEYSRKNIKQFFTFLRNINNIESFSSGKYFYIPFLETNLDINDFLIFTILTFLCHLLDWVDQSKTGNIFITFFSLCLVYFIPVLCPVILMFKNERIFLALALYLIHFRYGLICFIYLYLLGISKILIKK
ncbi:GPI transamidase component GAA1 [Vairimorpha necatrix]|uniref:GPI transamidase component GAA1 n=1 Tax=Vairimorpha necatrix TaxID=6039 RepID=A0AAX4JAU3_9MICR